MSRTQSFVLRLRDLAIAMVVLIGLWWLYVSMSNVQAFLLPHPAAVGEALLALFESGDIWRHLASTLSVVSIGLATGTLLGLAVGALLAHFEKIGAWLDGTILLLQTAPKIALAPLFLIWFGLGLLSKVLLVVSLVFFPVMIGTLLGLRSVDSALRDLARILRLHPWRVFLRIELPSAAADILAGVRVGALQAVVGAILAEWLSSKSGLGYLMVMANASFNAPLLFAAIALTVFIGIVMYFVLESLEAWLVYWK